jgi:hypothetical protein
VVLSGVGFPTGELPPLVAALLLVPVAACARRKRLDVLRPRGAATEWATLLVPLAAAVALGLLPVVRAGGFCFANDTYTYSAFAEWLQLHAYSEEARWEALSPVTGIPALWQSQGYDLGIAHWLALWQAAFRPATVLTVYPAVAAIGLALLTSAVWLAARQLLRLGRAGAGATALVFAIVPHALYWGHHNGFLQQAYALPLVLLGLVLLARAAPPSRWRAGTAALLALPFAFLLSVYLPLLPLLGFAAVVAAIPVVRRARRQKRLRPLAAFVAVAGALVALYSTRDLLSALSPLHGFATSVAGGHIPWGPSEFLQFALGTRVLGPGWDSVEVDPWSRLNRWLTPLYLVLVAAGLWLAARRPRTRPLAAAATVLALGMAYYALFVRDPWSGRLGHTWNVFKLAQWGWPFALLLAAGGLQRLAPRRPGTRLALLGLVLALPASQGGVHWPWSDRLGQAMRDVLPGTTLAEVPALKRRIQELPPGTLLVVGRPVNVHRWLATAVSLLAYPRAVVGDWADSGSLSNHPHGEALYARTLERWDGPHVVPIVSGWAPFQKAGFEDLGGGFARLQKEPGPRLLHVANPAGLDRGTGSGPPTFAMGRGRTKLVVFAPEAGRVKLGLALRAYAGRPGSRLLAFHAGGDYHHRAVRLASEGPPAATLPLSGATDLRLGLDLARGLNTVILVVDEGRGERDARQPVTVTAVRLVGSGP